jgi:hypothetical protein
MNCHGWAPFLAHAHPPSQAYQLSLLRQVANQDWF